MKIKLIAVVVFIIIFIWGKPFLFEVNSSEPIVVSVSHQPLIITYQTNVTITVTFQNDVNVTGIQIQYCSLEPNYLCHFPKIPMVRQISNVWIGFFVVLEEEGIIGYELFIQHLNGTIIAPNSIDYLGYENIIEPSSGVFYFTINLSISSTQNTTMNHCMFCLISAFTTFIVLKAFKNTLRKKN